MIEWRGGEHVPVSVALSARDGRIDIGGPRVDRGRGREGEVCMSQRSGESKQEAVARGRAGAAGARDVWAIALALLLGGGLLTGSCATAPEAPLQAKPIGAFAEVAGRWTGVLPDMRGAQMLTLSIKPDGTWEQMSATAHPVRLTGSAEIVSGQLYLRPHATGRLATATLHEGKGRRVLVVRSDDGRVVQYSAAAP
jgi:hypothetical protein